MQLIHLAEERREEWNRLVGRTPESGFMQSWEWSRFKEAGGQQVIRLGVADQDSRLIAGAMVFSMRLPVGSSVFAVPHGPVLPWQQEDTARQCYALLLAALQEAAASVQAPALRLEPLLHQLPSWLGAAVRAPLDLIPTPTLIVDLEKGEEELLAAMKPKCRYNLRLALGKGVETVFQNSAAAADDFCFLFELTCRRHDLAGESKEFFSSMAGFLGGALRFYLSSYRGMLLSAAAVILFGGRATFLYGGSSPFLRSVMAPYAMHWKIIQDAKAAGCRSYDLFGIAPADSPLHPYANFSRFKSGFGGQVLQTAGAHDCYFYPQLASLWVEQLRRVGGSLG